MCAFTDCPFFLRSTSCPAKSCPAPEATNPVELHESPRGSCSSCRGRACEACGSRTYRPVWLETRYFLQYSRLLLCQSCQSYQKKLPIANPRPVSRISSHPHAVHRWLPAGLCHDKRRGNLTQRNAKVGDEATPKHLQSESELARLLFLHATVGSKGHCARQGESGVTHTPTIGLTAAIISVSVVLRVSGVESVEVVESFSWIVVAGMT